MVFLQEPLGLLEEGSPRGDLKIGEGRFTGSTYY
jgi:hypothetical protein